MHLRTSLKQNKPQIPFQAAQTMCGSVCELRWTPWSRSCIASEPGFRSFDGFAGVKIPKRTSYCSYTTRPQDIHDICIFICIFENNLHQFLVSFNLKDNHACFLKKHSLKNPHELTIHTISTSKSCFWTIYQFLKLFSQVIRPDLCEFWKESVWGIDVGTTAWTLYQITSRHVPTNSKKHRGFADVECSCTGGRLPTHAPTPTLLLQFH